MSPNTAAQLRERLVREGSNIARLTAALGAQLERFGFAEQRQALSGPLVNPDLRRDDYDGNQSLYAEWRTPAGALEGYVLIHGGGQLYAEFDVLRPHPQSPQWVIEAITAWGDSRELKAEPRLLPALGA